MQLNDFPIEKLSLYTPTKAVLYRIMIQNYNYFLPSESSKAVTEDYLLGVLKGNYFGMKFEERKELRLKNDITASKLDLIEEISKLVKKPLGFTLNQTPDRDWLLDILNTLNPKNKIISGDPATVFTRKLPKSITIFLS